MTNGLFLKVKNILALQAICFSFLFSKVDLGFRQIIKILFKCFNFIPWIPDRAMLVWEDEVGHRSNNYKKIFKALKIKLVSIINFRLKKVSIKVRSYFSRNKFIFGSVFTGFDLESRKIIKILLKNLNLLLECAFIKIKTISFKKTYILARRPRLRSGIQAIIKILLKCFCFITKLPDRATRVWKDMLVIFSFSNTYNVISNSGLESLEMYNKKVLLLNFFSVLIFVCSGAKADSMPIVSIYDMMKNNPSITYAKCHDAMSFDYKPFPLSVYPEYQPSKGLFAETFVATIPHGAVCSSLGFVVSDNAIVKELLSQTFSIGRYQELLEKINVTDRIPKKMTGRVAVLTRVSTDIYGHWLVDVLGRLEFLRMHNIAYDWLYVPFNCRYMHETLTLLGVDPSKIIQPYNDNFYIQADELIVPSLTIRRIPAPGEVAFSPVHPCTFYCADWNINFLRTTFLPYVNVLLAHRTLPEKVFISRKDASSRRMVNEDEVFALFEPYGFTQVSMTHMSFIEQIALFHHAKIIVAAHGSSLTNLIFCEPGTKVIEIFQNQFDSGFWQLSDQRKLEHYCIKTQDDNVQESFKVDTYVPIEIMQNFVNSCDWLS